MYKIAPAPNFDDFPLRVRRLITEEAAILNVPVEDIVGHGRRTPLVHARWRIWARQRATMSNGRGGPISLLRIATMWRRNHTTVMHGIEKADVVLSGVEDLSRPRPLEDRAMVALCRFELGRLTLDDYRNHLAWLVDRRMHGEELPAAENVSAQMAEVLGLT